MKQPELIWAGIWRRSGIAILSLFLTAVHTGVLGAFLTFSDSLWYFAYTPELFSIAPVADQQLAGLVMWIPGGFAYVTTALLLMTNSLRLSEQQVRKVQR